MARDKIHLLRCASAERIDLFRPLYARRADGKIEVRGGVHCDTRPNGLDHYTLDELWVIEPSKLDAIRSVVGEIERAASAATGGDDFARARARDAVSVAVVEHLLPVLKGAKLGHQWASERGCLPE